MKEIKILLGEHEQIEREILELEFISREPEINYPNLIHTFKKICELWNPHEQREIEFFERMNNREILMPEEILLTDHGILKKYIDNIKGAIKSGSDYGIKRVLENEMQKLIQKLRNHIEFENEIFYSLPNMKDL